MSDPTLIKLLIDILNEFSCQKESLRHLEVTTDRCINGIETNQIGISELLSSVQPVQDENSFQQFGYKDKQIECLAAENKELKRKMEKVNKQAKLKLQKRKRIAVARLI